MIGLKSLGFTNKGRHFTEMISRTRKSCFQTWNSKSFNTEMLLHCYQTAQHSTKSQTSPRRSEALSHFRSWTSNGSQTLFKK